MSWSRRGFRNLARLVVRKVDCFIVLIKSNCVRKGNAAEVFRSLVTRRMLRMTVTPSTVTSRFVT